MEFGPGILFFKQGVRRLSCLCDLRMPIRHEPSITCEANRRVIFLRADVAT